MFVDVRFTPKDYPDVSSKKCSVVIIDVFRATTTITTAIARGCSLIVPTEKVDDAFSLKKMAYPTALLAGERLGRPIEGFDLGNSPLEYTAEVVGGKPIIMTTTNGTMVFSSTIGADAVYIASFINADAVCRKLRESEKDVIIMCAGTEGKFSLEDTLCAGLIVSRLMTASLSDTAMAAQAMYRDFQNDLIHRVILSSHAVYLSHIGFGDDIEFCLQRDIFDVVPVFANGIITK